jgi:hypothetical protein
VVSLIVSSFGFGAALPMIVTNRFCKLASTFWRGCTIAGGLLLTLVCVATLASARDFGQWEKQDPKIRKWFNSLMMPDMPAFSCCGKADAYWSDTFETKGELYIAVITDTRADAPLGRRHIPPGTRVEVPNHRIKWDQGNPTGHGWIFIGGDEVFCYLPPSGV